MNKFTSIILGTLLAATSIAAFSQNANAAEVKHHHDDFNRDPIAFDNTKLLNERQIREQRAHELRERQAHERQIREQRTHELRERQAHERQIREQRTHELRERQTHERQQTREQRAHELRERQAREQRTHDH